MEKIEKYAWPVPSVKAPRARNRRRTTWFFYKSFGLDIAVNVHSRIPSAIICDPLSLIVKKGWYLMSGDLEECWEAELIKHVFRPTSCTQDTIDPEMLRVWRSKPIRIIYTHSMRSSSKVTVLFEGALDVSILQSIRMVDEMKKGQWMAGVL